MAERKDIDLASVCREELELLRAALPGTTLSLETSGATQGHWDPSRMRQMLGNLVSNAAKYGDGSSAIEVNVDGDDGDGEVRLSVANAGPVIPKAELKNLFEPLRRHGSPKPKGGREGMGLGLFIVREIATSHHGHISVESDEGRTRFAVVLPKR